MGEDAGLHLADLRTALEGAAIGHDVVRILGEQRDPVVIAPLVEQPRLVMDQRGDRIGLLGANGTGKTTLLKLMLSGLQHTSGTVVEGTKIDVAFVGSCTNGRLSDFREVARYLEGRRVSPHVKAIAVPGSQIVGFREVAEQERIYPQGAIRRISGKLRYEREVAAHLMSGLTSKEIGKALEISHRTVEIYRARLMRKYGAHSTPDLVHRLLAG